MNLGASLGHPGLGSAVGRDVGAGQVLRSGAVDSIALTLDLTRHPTPTRSRSHSYEQ